MGDGEKKMERKKLKADEKVFHMVIDRIIAHRIRPGDKIYEPDLAEGLQLSRTPVRHALSRLVAEGVLEKTRGKRGYTLPILTQQDMEDVFDVRSCLEGKAAYLAARRRTSEDLSYLRELNERERSLYHLGQRKEEYAEVNELFHSKIVDISRNEYISRYFRQAYWRSSLYTFHFGLFYNTDMMGSEQSFSDKGHRTYREHRKIIDAVDSGDSSLARELMEDHIHNTIRRRGLQVSPQ
jgi:DNA-binding GntR family transcriptional regulator